MVLYQAMALWHFLLCSYIVAKSMVCLSQFAYYAVAEPAMEGGPGGPWPTQLQTLLVSLSVLLHASACKSGIYAQPFGHHISRGHLDTPPKIFPGGKISIVTSIATGTPRNAINLHSLVFWPWPRVRALSATAWEALQHATSQVNFCHTQEALQTCKDTGMLTLSPVCWSASGSQQTL